jgi:hypothetical protein
MFIKSLIAAFTLEQKTEENQSPCRSTCRSRLPITSCRSRPRPRPDHLALMIHVDLAADHTLALAVPIAT